MARKITVEIVADTSQLNRKFTEAAASAKIFNREVERGTRGVLAGTVAIAGMGRAIAFASAQFLGGYGLAFALAHSTKAAIDFQQQMVLIKTQAGGLTENIAQLSKGILNLAPQVGIGPEELAKGLYHIESAGDRGGKALKELRIAAMGAKIGMDDLESVTNALVAAEKSGLKGTADLSHAMGVLDAITGAGNLRLADLTKALHSGVTGTAREVGISLEDLGGALSVLTIQGVPAQQAATRLRTSLALLAAPTKQAQKELKDIGIGPLQLAKTIRNQGLLPGLELLSQKLQASGKSAEGMTATIVRAFGAARSSATIIQLLQHLNLLRDGLERIQVGTAQFGQKWALQQKTAAQATDRLKASVQTMEIFVGQALMPTVVHVSNAVSKWLSNSDNQKRVQRDVTQVVQGLTKALTELWHVLENIAAPLGGLHNLLRAIVAIKLGQILFGWGRAVTAFTKTLWGMAAAETAVESSMLGGTAAAGAGGAARAGAGTAARGAMTEAMVAGMLYPGAATGVAGKRLATGAVTEGITEAELTSMFGRPVYQTRGGQYQALGETRSMTGFTTAQNPVTGRFQAASYPPQEAVTQVGYRGALMEGSEGAGLFLLNTKSKEAALALSKTEQASLAASKALGTGGLVATVGLLSYQLSSMLFSATNLNKKFGDFGGWIADHMSGNRGTPQIDQGLQGTAQTIHSNVDKALAYAKTQIQKVGTDAFDNIQVKKSALVRFANPFGDAFRTEASKSMADLEKQIEQKFHFSKHAADIFIKDMIYQLQSAATSAHWDQLQAEIGAKVAHASAIAPKPIEPPTTPASLTVAGRPGIFERLAQEESAARLQIAKGDESANARLVAILRDRIAADEKYAKIQEGLIKKGIGNANDHAKTIAKLNADEAQAYSDIASATKDALTLPMNLQIQQARAALTPGTSDDAKAAQAINSWVKNQIKVKHLTGQALLQALQLMVAGSKQDQGFQIPIGLQLKQADAALTASTADDKKVWMQVKKLAESVRKDKNSTTQAKLDADNAILSANQALAGSFQIPLSLQLEQATASLTESTADDNAAWRKVKKLAEKTLKSKKSTTQEKLDATNALKQAQDALNTFTVPYSLRLAEAQAAVTKTTLDDVSVAKRIKRLIENLIKNKKLSGEALIDALGVLKQENDTIGTSGVATAYHMASTHKLTADMGLTRQQRIALEQRMAQAEAHGGRVPNQGVYGAMGQAVGNVSKGVQDATKAVSAHAKALYALLPAAGLVKKGNIDLNNRKVVRNKDGSFSTEESISIGVGKGMEELIPTVYNGAHHTVKQAIEHFKKTGQNLGTFDSIKDANAYAERLHKRQASYYSQKIHTPKMTVNASTVQIRTHGATGPSTVIININGGDQAAVERTVMRVIQKNDRRTSKQTRGRYGKAVG